MSLFAIHSRNTITPGGVKDVTVIISNGIITDIADGVPGDSNLHLTDIGNKALMAGVIDPHVHINEPGRTSWEGFETATKAAIAGGITMLVDMPLNSSPVTTTSDAFDAKMNSTRDQLHTNCGFWGGIIPGNENEIEKLIEKGVLGFKAFLIHSGIDEFPNVTDKELRKAMPVIAKYNLPLLVHCELADDKLGDTREKTSYQDYLGSRPRHWEDNAIAMMINLCREYACRTHIVHLSSASSIDQIAKAKHDGLPLTAETGQHYLSFSAEEIKDGQTQFKCAPPIREKENNERIWQALKDGTVDFVATDHSPSLPAMKAMDSGDFTKAWGGISSLQLALPALWTVARKHNCSLTDIARWLSEKPAVLTGQKTRKGKLEKGFDADLVIWDPDKDFTVTEDIIQHKHKLTPYIKRELAGVVEATYLGGEKVFEKGKFLHLNRGKIITL